MALARTVPRVTRVSDKDLNFLRAYAMQWRRGESNSWVARNRAVGFGVIIAALGCMFGIGWRGWSALDAALLLYVDMLFALLADYLKAGLAAPAVRQALTSDNREDHCWVTLAIMRVSHQLDVADIRAAGKHPPPAPARQAAPGSNQSHLRQRSLVSVLVYSTVIVVLIGAGLWLGLSAAPPEQTMALSDPGFFVWLALAGTWRLGDSLYLLRRNRIDTERLDLVPSSGVGPGITLVFLPLIAISLIFGIPEGEGGFWLLMVAAYVFTSLAVGAGLILSAWQRERWMYAFVAKDARGELAPMGEVLIYTATRSADPEPRGGEGPSADEQARAAYALIEDRGDWVDGEIRCDDGVQGLIWMIFAGLLWLFAVFAIWAASRWGDELLVWGAILLTVGALVPTYRWLRGLWRHLLFGKPLLQLDTTPVRTGKALRGRLKVQIGAKWNQGARCKLHLACVRERTRPGRNGGSHTDKTVEWEHRWEAEVERAADGSIIGIPVELELPAHRPETLIKEQGGDKTRIDWTLNAHLVLKGPDFRTTFSLPVFNPTTGVEIRQPRRPEVRR